MRPGWPFSLTGFKLPNVMAVNNLGSRNSPLLNRVAEGDLEYAGCVRISWPERLISQEATERMQGGKFSRHRRNHFSLTGIEQTVKPARARHPLKPKRTLARNFIEAVAEIVAELLRSYAG